MTSLSVIVESFQFTKFRQGDTMNLFLEKQQKKQFRLNYIENSIQNQRFNFFEDFVSTSLLSSSLSSSSRQQHYHHVNEYSQSWNSWKRSKKIILSAELRSKDGNNTLKDRLDEVEESNETNSVNGITDASNFESMTLAEELQLKSQQKMNIKGVQPFISDSEDNSMASADSESSKSIFSSIPSPVYLALAMILGIGFVGSLAELGTGKPLLGYYPTLAVIGVAGPGLIACFLLAIKKAQEETIEDNEKFKKENPGDWD